MTEAAPLHVRVRYATFADWWEPLTSGAGTGGGYVRSLSPQRRELLRQRCRQFLPEGPFEVSASAWAVAARV